MIEKPATRRLRILAFDPSLATRLETSVINEITVQIPWEDTLGKGPIGEYIEVIDIDPASDACYQPVDLNDPYLLAQDGLPPSESNPQFHQQMVYVVAMTTIRNFERALGRPALWADRRYKIAGKDRNQFVQRLRIYPHALRDRNAYYSPEKKALLFGYFPVTTMDAHNTPGTIVFTCLSHDIIAHEVTHALLDGVHPRFNEPTNPDVLAFHEAFADIVALFQHFSHPTVLVDQIRRTRGELESESLLAQLAQQFGQATGRGSALRDALGSVDETGTWVPRRPDPHALDRTWGPHERGSILVAAVFRAFLLTYRARSADLFRIASQGTGTLPDGDIHPDLTNRLAAEAAGSADRILQMCIRAIDYCPPVDITFGDFLRGVVTADVDFAPGDGNRSLIAFIESFREWGIYPRGVSSMGLDALEWPSGDDCFEERVPGESLARVPEPMRKASREAKKESREGTMKESFVKSVSDEWTLGSNRKETWEYLFGIRAALKNWLFDDANYGPTYAQAFGLEIGDAPSTVYRTGPNQQPSVEVHSVRPAIRRTVDGAASIDLVVEITQRRRGYFTLARQQEQDLAPVAEQEEHGDFTFRAGCTVLINPKTGEVRRVIATRGTITDDDELNRVRNYLTGAIGVVGNAFDAGLPESRLHAGPDRRQEPFALLHQMED
ncbi:MAG: hypothetical protein H0V37_10760 [Chloroflexia bacterium]|nr:hypothetical protein [Chloroflexia bacterium]